MRWIRDAFTLLVGALLGILVLSWVLSKTIFASVVLGTVLAPTYDRMAQFSPEDSAAVENLIQRQVLLTHDQLLATLTSFYETLIVILVALIGIVGVVAYLSVRSLSITAAENMVRETVKNYVTNSREFNERIADSVETYVVENVPTENELAQRLTIVEARIADMDNAEQHP